MDSSHDPAGNRVLARLSESDRASLMEASTPFALNSGDLIHRFGEKTNRYVFPLSGMISLTVPTPEGDNVEVALVGREGVFGVNSLLDGGPDLQAIAQVAGNAIAMPVAGPASRLRAALRDAAGPYVAGMLVELAQTAACNRVHSVEERTARWLLQAADTACTTELNLTHEFMAMMLGVRRASVTVVVGGFEAAGLIDAQRRRISIADRKGLLDYTCSCFEVIRAATTGRAD